MAALCCSLGVAQDYSVRKIDADLSGVPQVDAEYWEDAPEVTVNLMAQMIVNPKPAEVKTDSVRIRIVHDGTFVAFRMQWRDTEVSEAGRLAEYSDAVALQFPVRDNAAPPPIFMGAVDDPVHIFHWRAQYQHDAEHGKKTVKDIYPNMSADMYPNDFPDRGNLKPATQEEVDVFLPAVATGNPQSSPKNAVDEMMSEGFGTSAVIAGGCARGRGAWRDGAWVVVISRALACPNGSTLVEGEGSAYGVAVWQGGAGEVGSRKSITMMWTGFRIGGN